MKAYTVIGCMVGAAVLGAFTASGQSSIGDVRTGDTRIGDIRTGDMTQTAHTHVYVGRDDGRSGRRGGGAGISFHGIFIPKFSATLRERGFSEDVDISRAIAGGASFMFKLGEAGRLELGGDYIPLKLDEDSSVKLRLIPATASLRFGIPIGDSLFFYGAGGGGYSFNELRVGGEKETGGGLVIFAGGGLEVALGSHVSLRGEARKFWHKWDVEGVDVELDHIQARASMIFWF